MKTLDIENNFLSIESEISNLSDSKTVIVSAPYEHSVTYGKGTCNAPKEILKASAYVEFYDDEFDKEYCNEFGIATLEPIDFEDKIELEALDLIQNQVEHMLELEKFVVTIGGEHTISIAPIKAHYKRYPEMSILHFDAHSDLRDEYEDSKYSHACFMSRVAEFFPANRITQVGIRAQSKEESSFIRANGVNTFYASSIRKRGHGKKWQKEIVKTLADDIYITFDVDYFDPSIMPSTGTPEPDGFFYSETLDVFRAIRKAGKNIIGFDLVELAPIQGFHHPNLTAARLIYKLLNFSVY